MLLALPVLATGCNSRKTAHTPQRYHTIEGSFTDQAARTDYVERRTNELKQMGVSDVDAASRASREWFSRTGTTTQVPTKYELQRREAEADIRTYLDKRKEPGS
jgi:hypothetical protein